MWRSGSSQRLGRRLMAEDEERSLRLALTRLWRNECRRGKTFGMTASRSRHPERFAGSCVRSHRRTRQSGGISLRAEGLPTSSDFPQHYATTARPMTCSISCGFPARSPLDRLTKLRKCRAAMSPCEPPDPLAPSISRRSLRIDARASARNFGGEGANVATLPLFAEISRSY